MDSTTYRALSSKTKQQIARQDAKHHYEAACFYTNELAILKPLKTRRFERALVKLNLRRVIKAMWASLIIAEAMKQGDTE